MIRYVNKAFVYINDCNPPLRNIVIQDVNKAFVNITDYTPPGVEGY